jgi:error-prone DNA polymerase
VSPPASHHGYVELHCHSGFSFLDGASHPEELVLAAKAAGYPAMALTDHDGLYGSMEFAHAARQAEIQPITGAELTLSGLFEDEREAPDRPVAVHRGGSGGWHVTVLVESQKGYGNLCRLLTKAHMESPREDPWLPVDTLLDPERTEGLILLTGCRRSPLLASLERSFADGETFTRRLMRAFGPGNVFVEIQDNAVRGDAARGKLLGRLADRFGLPVVATGNVHYHRPERHRLQDVLVAIRNRSTLDGSHAVRRPNSCFHLATPAEMAHRFRSRPDAVTNTLLVAERCARFDLTRNLGYTFPDFDGSEGGGALETLAAVCVAELSRRYAPGTPQDADARERLHVELELVDLHGLAGFFLVYRDIIELAREVAAEVRGRSPRAFANLPPGRGRGSSVSSIICYLIGLSTIDPVEANLFLGRFLNEALRTVPDIDLDFSRDIREELILRVYRKYGQEHTGLVCTFPTYRLRSAVREVGKALDLPFGELEKLAKLAEHRSASGLREEMESLPEFKDRRAAPLWEALADLADDIAGLPRHISQHVGGMVISSRPLVELVPLEPAAMEGRVLCQWDKDSCEDAGFIKIDFLALGMLSLVEDAVDLIAERHDEPPDLTRIDVRDEAVYDRICDGDTVGLFQVESRAQIQMLRRVRPRTLEDLTVQVAIVRPGPIVAGAVNPYVRHRERQREDPAFRVPYDHPLLEEALEETLGVIIFQDQVLQVCRALAGYSDGEAESLRRAMSRKRSHEAMVAHWERFRDGATARGVGEETARRVFKQVSAFSEFGFPKSHAAAFGLLAYQSAWLRHYYPVEYYVALFNNQPMGFYSLDALGRDARRNAVRILLPHVNRSAVPCTAEGDDLRVGLGFVRGWGQDIAERVVAERERGGPFLSLADFLRRTPAVLKRPAVENLIWVGGMGDFGLTRRELLWQAGLWLGPEAEEERRTRELAERGDHPQRVLELGEPYGDMPFPDLDAAGRMVAEYRMLRFSSELHPISLFRDRLPADTVTLDRFADLPQHSTVRVAGIVTARQRPSTAKGYVFILMEDEAGQINVIVKPDIYERDRSAVRLEPFLVVRGRLQKDGATMNVIASEVEGLRFAPGPPRSRPERPRSAGRPEGSHRMRRLVGALTDAEEMRGALPDTTEWWAEHDAGEDFAAFRHLTALRQSPPGVKNFG